MSELEKMCDNVLFYARRRISKVIAANFNALTLELSSKKANSKRRSFLEAFAQLYIFLANKGNGNAFRNERSGSFVSLILERGITGPAAKARSATINWLSLNYVGGRVTEQGTNMPNY